MHDQRSAINKWTQKMKQNIWPKVGWIQNQDIASSTWSSHFFYLSWNMELNFFLLILSCFPLFFARFQDLLTLARVRFVRAYASVSEAARMPCSHPRCFYGQNYCETWNKWFCDLFPRSLSFPAFGLEKNQSVNSWEKKLTGYIN